MVAGSSTPIRSANAGEFSPSAAGRIDIKQYYSAGLAYKNVEPVPQGGFRQMGGSMRKGLWRAPLENKQITSPVHSPGPHTGTQTVWTGTVSDTIAMITVFNFAISAGTATFTVERNVGGNWIVMGGPFAVNASGNETRISAFPPGEQQTVGDIRIRATFSTSATATLNAVSARAETSGTPVVPRFVSLTTDDGTVYAGYASPGMVDFFTDAGHCGTAYMPGIQTSMLPDLDFYAEGNTIGVFHNGLETQRIFLVTAGQNDDWRVDNWPYTAAPRVDLGGVYPKQNDVWSIFISWTGNPQVYLTLTVNGETTPAEAIGGGTPSQIGSANPGDFNNWALALQTALIGLPSLGAGVTVAVGVSGTDFFNMEVTFGGAFSGVEYDFSASVSNTADATALPFHTQIGETMFEALWSGARGWPGAADLFQDRMIHSRIPAVTASFPMSEAGEYFTFNIEALGDNAARLDKIRSQTSETVLAIKESQYLLLFTDRASYFSPNRTIERNSPVNIVKASETGIQPNCKPFDLQGVDYYVAINPGGLESASEGGRQLQKIVYDEVSTRYNADPVSLLASHLVDKVIRSLRQRPLTDLDAAKAWLMRTDGRLIAGQIIDSQEILGFFEWIAASGGLVREIGIDGENRLWLAIERAGAYSIELYDTSMFLQDGVTTTPDMAGQVTGLPYEDGATVWALADGFVVGPLTVASGVVELEDAYSEATIGRWQAPRYETMPQVFVTRTDDVVFRPGRIHTMHLNVIDTTSLAIGANGQPVEDVPLTRLGDPDDGPPPARSELVNVMGLVGSAEGTTAVITQTRPGALRVRDFSIGAKL